MDLEKAYSSQLETLRFLFEAKSKDLIADKQRAIRGEIGSHFGGIGPSAVTQNTRRLEERLKGDAKLSEKVNKREY